jgi:16S rRNA (uracil1498-N3)-methyltransferase
VYANANPIEFAGIQFLKMPRVYLPVTQFKENQISVTGEKARYLATVLRCKNGDKLVVFDGKGNCLRTKILRADRREVVVEIMEKFSCDTESPLNIILVQGILKGQKMDIVIQKATELGVKEIMPVITERSQPRETRKVARWIKIAEEASRQSGRSIIPLVHETMHFKDCLSSLVTRYSLPSLNGLIFYEEGGVKISEAVSLLVTRHSSLNPPSASLTKGIIETGYKGGFFVIIGPEGGFTREEVTLAEGNGFIITSIGKRILRAETAAISAITLVQFLSGDLG